jgi:hypothetical protein
MITIRGKILTLSPLTLTDIGRVYDSVLALATCKPTIKILQPEMFENFVQVVALVVRRQIPDATNEEVNAALNEVGFANLGQILIAISGPSPKPFYIHNAESSHVQ